MEVRKPAALARAGSDPNEAAPSLKRTGTEMPRLPSISAGCPSSASNPACRVCCFCGGTRCARPGTARSIALSAGATRLRLSEEPCSPPIAGRNRSIPATVRCSAPSSRRAASAPAFRSRARATRPAPGARSGSRASRPPPATRAAARAAASPTKSFMPCSTAMMSASSGCAAIGWIVGAAAAASFTARSIAGLCGQEPYCTRA